MSNQTQTLAALAHADQMAAREREFDRKAQMAAAWFFILIAPVVVFSILAHLGIVPALPWSPMGKAQQ